MTSGRERDTKLQQFCKSFREVFEKTAFVLGVNLIQMQSEKLVGQNAVKILHFL